MGLLLIRLRKLAFSIAHPSCWPALARGVAPSAEHFAILRSLSVDRIIDVGANRGQFSLACRVALPGVPIMAFEPIPGEAATFRTVHGMIPDVSLFEMALGETNGVATLHLSNRADSSSLLPIGRQQTEIFDDTGEVGTISVPVRRLDEVATEWPQATRQLLKLDVQGFELNVLKGAVATLGSCAYVYAECSEVALYEGQSLRTEIASFLKQHGFDQIGRYNCHNHAGRLIQADYLFGCKASAPS